MNQRTVHLFVFDTLADWEPAFAIAGLHNVPRHDGAVTYQVKTVGPGRAPVVTRGGLTIVPDMVLEEVTPEQSALLLLPGGDSWDAGEHLEAVELARRFVASGVPVAAICGATGALARAGLLDNVRHTSNARAYLEATGYSGGHLYQEAPAVTDGAIITAGATAAVDFAYQIFRLLGVYSGDVLEAWYGLFKTGDPAFYAQLMQLAQG